MKDEKVKRVITDILKRKYNLSDMAINKEMATAYNECVACLVELYARCFGYEDAVRDLREEEPTKEGVNTLKAMIEQKKDTEQKLLWTVAEMRRRKKSANQ